MFADDELLAITDNDIIGYLEFQAYGKVNPTANDCLTKARSITLLQYKKSSISHFMKNRSVHHQWNEIRKEGNQRRSDKVNGVVCKVQKFEAMKEGQLKH